MASAVASPAAAGACEPARAAYSGQGVGVASPVASTAAFSASAPSVPPPLLVSATATNTVRALKQWTTRVQQQLYLKCVRREEGRTEAPVAGSAASSAALGVDRLRAADSSSAQAASASAAAPSSSTVPHSALVAISTSQTFLFLIQAVQSTHPARARSVATALASGQVSPISMEARFFPLRSNLLTIASLREAAQPCVGNLHRGWGGTMTTSLSSDAASLASASSDEPLLRHSDDILMGRLVFDAGAAQLYLQDETGRIPVVMVMADASLLGRWCVFPTWHYLITESSTPCVLEINAAAAIPLPSLDLFSPVTWATFGLPPLPTACKQVPTTPFCEIASLVDLPTAEAHPVAACSGTPTVSTTPDARAAGGKRKGMPSTAEPPSKRAKKNPSTQLFHLRGVVCAVSPLIRHDKATFFFVELVESVTATSSSSTLPLSTVILFTGSSSLQWYPFLHIGHEYTITRVRTSVLFQDQPGHQRMVFVTTAPPAGVEAHYCPFEQTTKQTLVISRKTMDAHILSGPSSPAPSVSTSANGLDPLTAIADGHPSSFSPTRRCPGRESLTYTGVITANPTWGVYQLDHDDAFTLHLHALSFHEASSNIWLTLGVGLRIGARVRLHHVHLTMRGQRSIGFVCCLYSHIEILAFSPFARMQAPCAVASSQFRWYSQLWLRHPAAEVALYLRVALAWKRKMGLLVSSQQLLRLPTGATETRGIFFLLLNSRDGAVASSASSADTRELSMEMYAQFLQHESCPFGRPSPGHDQCVPCLIPLHDWPKMRLIRHLRESLLPDALNAASVLTPTEWSYRTLHSSQLQRQHPQAQLVGLLQSTIKPASMFTPASSDRDDPSSPVFRCAWQLVDATGAIDCVVVGDVSPTYLNAIVLVRSYLIVVESSPFISPDDAAAEVDKRLVTVVMFDVSDIVVLHAAATSNKSSAGDTRAASSASLLLFHKSEVITKPSVSSSVATPAAAASSSARVSPQAKLTSASFNTVLNTSLEVQLLDAATQTMRPAFLQLDPSVAELYSFLKIHSVIDIMGSSVSSSSKHSSSRAPIFHLDRRTIVRTRSPPRFAAPPPLLKVRDVLVCPIPANPIPSGGVAMVDLVSFRGIVLAKQFRLEPSSRSGAPPTYRRWWLSVRDVDLPHTVHVYVDPALHCFPLLLPGSLVHFHRMSRRIAPSFQIQVEDVEGSHIELIQSIHLMQPRDAEANGIDGGGSADHRMSRGEQDDAWLVRSSMQSCFPCGVLPQTYLNSLSPFAPHLSERVHCVRARVGILSRLLMWWFCRSCNQVLQRGGRCGGALAGKSAAAATPRDRVCSITPPQLTIECTVLIDDGSGVATLYLDGNLVWDLLSLSALHRGQLEALSLDLGRFEYIRLHHKHGDDARPLAADDVDAMRQVRIQVWNQRLRENYGGKEVTVFARQVILKTVMREAMLREKRQQATTQGAASSSSSAAQAAPAAASTSGTSIPFSSCNSREISLGGHKFTTLQAPTLTLKAIEVQPMRHPHTRNQARTLLAQLRQQLRT